MSESADRSDGDPPPITVVVSRFPKFTETFVVGEVVALEQLGWTVYIHPLLPPEPEPHQPDAKPLVERARYGEPWGRASWAALGRALRRQPASVAQVVGRLVRDTWRRPSFLIKDLVLLPRICAVAEDVVDLGVGHVHAHFATHAGFAAWSIRRLTGTPYSIVAHGSDVHRHQQMLATKVAEAEFVATVSGFNQAVIRSVCRPEDASRVVVVRLGIDLERLVDGGGTPNVPASPPRVLCVGSLHEVKGQAYLVRALARLRGNGRDVEVVFVGDGPDRSMLVTLADDLGVSGAVEFVGPLPHGEVLDLYGTAALVVAPSVASSDGRKEGIPTVLLEAMAAGVPVIASDLAGVGELVRDDVTGLLTRPGDVESLAAAIERLLDDAELRCRLCSGAASLLREEFDRTATTRRMGDLMLQGGSRG